MADALPYASTCCDPCDSPVTVQTPGPAGAAGAAGAAGTNGTNAYTTTTAAFTMPAEAATVSVTVGSTAWMVVGQTLYVQTAGWMDVVSITNNLIVVLRNIENTALSQYTPNAAPTTSISAGSKVAPGGLQGPSGSLSGAASGDLEGTYPGPRIAVTTSKGDLIVNNNLAVAPRNTRLGVGANGTVLHCDSTQATGLQHRGIDLAGTNTTLSNQLPITRGGTGQATATLAFNALSPVTTRGDIIIRDATNNARLAVGAANTVLKSDGTDPAWGKVTSAMIDATAKYLGRYGVLGSLTADLNFGAATDQSFTISSARYIVRKVIIENASVNLGATAARFGIYTAAAKGGTAIVTDPNSELTALTASTKFDDVTIAATPGTDVLTSTTVYFHLSVVHGVAATMKVWLFGEDLSA